MMWWLLFILIFLLISFYAFQAIKTATKIKFVYYVYFIICVAVLINFIYQGSKAINDSVWAGNRAYALGFLLALLTGQLLIIVLMFAEDLARFFIGIFSKVKYDKGEFYMPSRRNFIAKIALGLAAIPFSSLLYGMFKGKYNFKVLKYEIEFEDLPQAFDGYKITQISDIHCGSFDNKEKVKYGVDLIKQQKSDIIFFTGDLVNNRAVETKNWHKLFGSISAPDGVYSVLGNHDYGDYYKWKNDRDKAQNLKNLIEIQQKMGWQMLRNEHRTLQKDDQKIYIVGVENWGKGRFPKYGDIDKAGEGLTAEDFKILLSHDPSHWNKIVKNHPDNYQLTLSGHTHGMQFGIEIPGIIKWSPIQYKYKYWAGLYREAKRYINVNRGFGYLAYPGRVGIWPEITVIKLKKKMV